MMKFEKLDYGLPSEVWATNIHGIWCLLNKERDRSGISISVAWKKANIIIWLFLPSQALNFWVFFRMALMPGMAWSYWWRTSKQCSWNSLSFWERLCRSKTASRKNWIICSLYAQKLFSDLLIFIHCLCNIIIRALTTCKRKKKSLNTQSKVILAENLFHSELYWLISSNFQISEYFLASKSKLPRKWHPLKVEYASVSLWLKKGAKSYFSIVRSTFKFSVD